MYLSLPLVTNPYHLLWFGLFTAAAITEVMNLVRKQRTVFFFWNKGVITIDTELNFLPSWQLGWQTVYCKRQDI